VARTKDNRNALETALHDPEKSVKGSKEAQYVLRLYIAGASLRSSRAIEQIKKICDEDLKGRCDLEVIDLYQHPALAEGEQIIAVPTLIKKLPPPLRRFVGDLHDTERILVGLNYTQKTKEEPIRAMSKKNGSRPL